MFAFVTLFRIYAFQYKTIGSNTMVVEKNERKNICMLQVSLLTLFINVLFHFLLRRMIGQNYLVNLKVSTVLTAYGRTAIRRTSIPNIGATRSALPSAQFHSPSSGA